MKAKISAACRALGFVVAVAHLLPNPTHAATERPYPNRPLRLVVPFPAGGPVEVLARVFTQRLAETMGQPFVIENRPGASGTIGTELVAKAPRDGYTLLITNCSHSSNVACKNAISLLRPTNGVNFPSSVRGRSRSRRSARSQVADARASS